MDADELTVIQAMTDNVVFVNVTASIREALQAMHDSDIRHVPVLDEDGELVGIVSDRDLRAFAPIVPVLDEAGENPQLELPVTQIMNTDVRTVTVEDDLAAAVDLMIEHRIGAVPVIDPDSNELVGIVSTIDALKLMRQTE